MAKTQAALKESTAAALVADVRRALREAATHPFVRRIEGPILDDGDAIRAIVHVDSNLPAVWRAAGASDNGVLAVEPVKFVFSSGYPLWPPTILLRDGFDRSHPHIQPRTDGRAEPCLVDGSPAELLRSRGIYGLVDQLARWLDKAAMVDLINPRQGWEPTRRDYLDDLLIVDRSVLEALPGRDAGGRAYGTTYFGEQKASAFILKVSDRRSAFDVENFPGRYSRHEEFYGGRTLTLVAWSGKLPSGSPFIAAKYMPEDVTNLSSLYSRAESLGCAAPLAVQLELLGRLAPARQRLTIPVGVILLARRPYDLAGTSSPIELCSYVLEYRVGEDLGAGSGVAVRAAGQRDRLSVPLLRYASGQRSEQGLAWSLVGCGSVGSKIAASMARCGRAPGLVVDRAYMTPHNFARHALLPGSDTESFGFSPKAEMLAAALSRLGQEVTASVEDVVKGDEVGRKSFWRKGPDMLVNTTGSLVVREALAAEAGKGTRPRVVEANLMAAGKGAYLTVEGRWDNPSTSDLACEAYRLIGQDDGLAEMAFGSEAQPVAVGQGCSSVTFPMPDSLLSAMTAPMATLLAGLHASGLPGDRGEVNLGRLSNDGLGQQWRSEAVRPFAVVEGDKGWSCRVSQRVLEAMRRDVDRKPGKEVGGVLIGRISDVSRAFHVVDLIAPPPDSVNSATEFVLGTQDLRERIAAYVARAGGSLYALGTWHNHLSPGGPSAKDLRTGLLIASHQITPVLMVIHAPDRLRFFVSEVDDGETWEPA